MRCLSVVLSLLVLSFFIGPGVWAYDYDFSKPATYTFAATPEDTAKLLYTFELMSFIESEYKNEIAATHLKANFRWNFDWQQSYLGAGSTYFDNYFSVMMFGGSVRAPGSDFAVVAFTLCHEIGHYLGGQPRQRLLDKNNDDWSSSEGQSDWFAATNCLPRVYQYFKNNKPHRLTKIDYLSEITPHCEAYNLQKGMCQWILSAGLGFGRFARFYYEREVPQVSFAIKALEEPEETLHSRYPSLQCRIDTVAQGAFCAIERLNQSAAAKSECVRPRCWYKSE